MRNYGGVLKKKTCSWLDGNINGGVQMLAGKVFSCCVCSQQILPKMYNDFSEVTAREIMDARKIFMEKLNNSEVCDGCPMIVEKDEEDIDEEKIGYLSFGNFSSCNLRCKYCYFTDEELSKPTNPMQRKILPFVEDCHKFGFLKKDFTLGLAGGEPLFFDDIEETCRFMSENYEESGLTLLSNSSVTSKAKALAPKLANLPKNIRTQLYTSIDAGTPETYKLIRGRDLYNEVTNNILTYAKLNSFTTINLKYILLNNTPNIEDKDIFGFLDFVNEVLNSTDSNIAVTIDKDMFDVTEFEGKILEAAAKLYYVSQYILNINLSFGGGGINAATPQGQKKIKKIKNKAQEYAVSEKSDYEKECLKILKNNNRKLQRHIQRYQNKINQISKDYKDKKILVYGAGVHSNILFDNCDFSTLNIKAVSDIKFDGTERYYGYKTVKFDDINNEDYDLIVFALLNKKYALEDLKNKQITLPFESII